MSAETGRNRVARSGSVDDGAGFARPPGATFRRSGFTLIEVLLALALFSVSVVVLASAYINVIVGLESVRVDRVLEQEMAFVRSAVLTAPDLETLEEGGELPTGELGLAYWEAELEPTAIADLFVVRVSITIEGTRETEGKTLNERLIVLRPGWSEPVDREELRAESKERIAELKLNRPL
ncbi:MAG: prepilin-type N-terminal cleavage/methylation domain-containing protein [Opitutaceae bacterium]